MNEKIDDNSADKPTLDSISQGLLGHHKVEVKVDLNKEDAPSTAPPWWESKLTVTIVAGLFATIIPVTTFVLSYFENEAKEVSLKLENELETARLKENFLLEMTESVIGKLTQNDLSYEAKMALYTFLVDISEEDSGTAKFAKDTRESTMQKMYKKLAEESAVLEEKQSILASFSVGDIENDSQSNQASIAKQETKQAEENVKSIQDILVTYEPASNKPKSEEKQIISLWGNIEVDKRYSIQGKLGTNISFKLYDSKPSTFGKLGEQIDLIEDGEVFVVEDKDVTFRGFKWLKVKLVDSDKSGWYSWENIRSELVLESQ